MKSFKEIAQKSITLAKIMEGRDKMDTEDIIRNYPDGFNIDEIEYITMTKGDGADEFWAFHIAGTKYFGFAGLILNKMFNEFLKEYDGDFSALYEEFERSGGITVKLKTSISKTTKRPVTVVEVL